MPASSQNDAPCYDWRMRALVTGGTGRIGASIAAALQADDWSVLAVGRADADISRPGEARALVERAASELGGLDLLVNAAAEGFAPKSVVDLSELVARAGVTDRDSVANGIAYDRAKHRIFVTGKNWPELYEIRLNSSVR